MVGEFVAASQGLGYLVFTGTANLDTRLTFAAVFLLAAMGITLPADYRESLLVHDGQERSEDDDKSFPWMPGCNRIAPLAEVVAQYKDERGWDDPDQDAESDSQDDERIKRLRDAAALGVRRPDPMAAHGGNRVRLFVFLFGG